MGTCLTRNDNKETIADHVHFSNQVNLSEVRYRHLNTEGKNCLIFAVKVDNTFFRR